MVKVKKKNRTGKKLTVCAVLLGVACSLLTLIELLGARSSYLEQYSKDTELYLRMLVTNGGYRAQQLGVDIAEGIISTIESDFPTSAKVYCLVGKDDTILFLRDAAETAELFDTTVEEYLGSGTKSRIPAVTTTTERLQNGSRYLVTRLDLETEIGFITVAICTQEAYLLAAGGLDVLLQRNLLYVGLLVIAYLASVVFLTSKIREKEAKEEELAGKLSQDRGVIERLEKSLESRNKGEAIEGEGGFYTKEVVERVLSELTPEQRERSWQVVIHLDEEDQTMLVRLGVLLDRLLNGVSVCCLWEENEYRVLMLNTEEEGAVNFAKQFILQYQNMFQKDIDSTRITIVRL